MYVGYELLGGISGRSAEHLVIYHKLISNKREWNSFIKYQTLDFVYVEVLNVKP